MRTKRLLCVCAAFALLLSVPARAAEAPDIPEALEVWEEPSTDSVPEVPEEPPDDSEEVPEISDIPEVPPETEETPEIPENPPEEDEPLEAQDDEAHPEENDSEAPEEDGEAGETEDEPAPQEDEPPVIHVELPDAGRVVVNPYHLEVNMDGVSSTDQIVSAPMPIVSYSSVPVAVTASVTGRTAPGSDAVFVQTPPRNDAWAKELFLFAEFQPAFDAYGSAFWSGQYTGASNQLVVTAGGSPAAQVLELAAGDMVPSYGAFRLFGSASGSPERMWSTEDTIQVTLTFTFVPLA